VSTSSATRFADSLFFAIFPDDTARARISDIAQRLRAQHQLKTRAIPADRFHITLHYLGTFDGLPADVLQKAAMPLPRCIYPRSK
jgi:RNA 2',3'-cyclic 3'-phosphodiesterase